MKWLCFFGWHIWWSTDGRRRVCDDCGRVERKVEYDGKWYKVP